MSESLKGVLGFDENQMINSAVFRAMSDSVIREVQEDAIYYEFPNDGVEFIIRTHDGRVVSVIISCDHYKGDLPYSLNSTMSPQDVTALLGTPSAVGGGKGKKDLLGAVEPWERYDWENLSMNVTHVEEGDKIKSVCLMLPNAVPR